MASGIYDACWEMDDAPIDVRGLFNEGVESKDSSDDSASSGMKRFIDDRERIPHVRARARSRTTRSAQALESSSSTEDRRPRRTKDRRKSQGRGTNLRRRKRKAVVIHSDSSEDYMRAHAERVERDRACSGTGIPFRDFRDEAQEREWHRLQGPPRPQGVQPKGVKRASSLRPVRKNTPQGSISTPIPAEVRTKASIDLLDELLDSAEDDLNETDWILQPGPALSEAARKARWAKNKKFRSWCATGWNDKPPSFTLLGKSAVCLFGSPEVCPRTGKKHWQLGGRFKSAVTMSALKKRLKAATPGFTTEYHVEPLRSSCDAHSKYCGKCDWVDRDTGRRKKQNPHYFEFGDLEDHQGARSDLELIKTKLQDGATVEDILEDHGFLTVHTYGRTFDRLIGIYDAKHVRTEPTKLYWYHGATGTGKSHIAMAQQSDTTRTYVHNCHGPSRGKWWDKLTVRTETIVLNDLRESDMPYHQLLQMADKYRMDMDRRNVGGVPLMAKRIIVTSCSAPEVIYSNRKEGDNIDQLMRRMGTKPDGSYGLNCHKVTAENRNMLYFDLWGEWSPGAEGLSAKAAYDSRYAAARAAGETCDDARFAAAREPEVEVRASLIDLNGLAPASSSDTDEVVPDSDASVSPTAARSTLLTQQPGDPHMPPPDAREIRIVVAAVDHDISEPKKKMRKRDVSLTYDKWSALVDASASQPTVETAHAPSEPSGSPSPPPKIHSQRGAQASAWSRISAAASVERSDDMVIG